MNAPRDDDAYIAWRIIDCCLREDLRGIMHRGSEAAPPPAARQTWPQPIFPERWWCLAHLPGGVLWLPVQSSDYMQSLRATGDGWLRETPQGLTYESGAEAWLALLAEGLDEETCRLHREYAAEAQCAAEHRALSRQAYQEHADTLAGALDAATWDERALRCDQVASHRDHPFYPTARAKTGFTETDMRAYAPEFDPTFALRWLALPREALQQTTPPPAFWPRMADVGLDPALATTHALLPVHPLTWLRLGEEDFPLPPGTHCAPRASLRVRPTLSVRTVMPVEHPDRHIKLPLLMRTLGALNLRLIKPSTIYDGHWFGQALTAIAAHDDALRNRYVHVDEAHGGHVDEARHLAYLVRGYPALPDATLAPTAALCSLMPDGRPFAAHLADRFHRGDLLAWWQDYATLLSDVHLRLWLAYGVALEANQQNSVLIYAPGQAPRLLMKDNDSARVLLPRLQARLLPRIAALGALRDPRIPVEDDAALARMFCTIILQLDLLAVLEGIAEWQPAWRPPMYARLRQILRATLDELAREGIDTHPAERLLQSPWLPVKYLLSAGSLLSKRITGAADINKFYGDSGPNFMLVDAVAATARQADGAA